MTPEKLKEMEKKGLVFIDPSKIYNYGSSSVFVGDIPRYNAFGMVYYDFLNGLRIISLDQENEYDYELYDDFTNTLISRGVLIKNGKLESRRRHFVKYRFKILKEGKVLFEHTMDLKGKNVVISLPFYSGIGDDIAWFSSVPEFQKKNKCHVTVVMKSLTSLLFQKQYPEIRFVEKVDTTKEDFYALYILALDQNQDNKVMLELPFDWRFAGFANSIPYALGLMGNVLKRAKVDLSAKRMIKDKYVCISAKASNIQKQWNNPKGWDEVVRFLKDAGYRVLVIDASNNLDENTPPSTCHFPDNGAEDFTGKLPLQERLNLIKDADFFIGLCSGLSWLSWLAKTPTVVIGGFSHPENEFKTPYRAINWHFCNSCWSDKTQAGCKQLEIEEIKPEDICPKHFMTPQMFQCSGRITSEHVINIIQTIPEFNGKISSGRKEYKKGLKDIEINQ